MSSVVPSSDKDAENQEKNWQAMMKLGRYAGICMVMIGIARFLLLQVLEGKTVLDATTVGSVGIGIAALVTTAIAPSPSALQAIGEARKAKHEAKQKKD
jgi:hypothetical protein